MLHIEIKKAHIAPKKLIGPEAEEVLNDRFRECYCGEHEFQLEHNFRFTKGDPKIFARSEM